MTAEQSKRAQRTRGLMARRALSAAERRTFSRQICTALTRLAELQRARRIFSYMAAFDEVDLSELHLWAAAAGKEVAFPLIGADRSMEAAVPESVADWEVGRFGILAPIPGHCRLIAPELFDAVVMPCVAFDDAGGRLGRGAGYYDRYLCRCPQAVRIVVAFEVQRCQRIPALESWDVPADICVTEKGAEHIVT